MRITKGGVINGHIKVEDALEEGVSDTEVGGWPIVTRRRMFSERNFNADSHCPLSGQMSARKRRTSSSKAFALAGAATLLISAILLVVVQIALFLRTIEVPRGGALSIDLFSLAGPRRFWVALVGVGLRFLWQFRRARRLSVFLILLLVGSCRSEPRQDSASDAGAQIVGDTRVEIIQPADQEILLGLSERDLTGDRKAEILRVIGVGRTIDELDADFTIESSGTTVYRFKLQPLTRTVGFDAGRRVISAEEHRLRLNDFGSWFFAQEKFQRPADFVDWLRMAAPQRLAQIPDVIARDRQNSEPRTGSAIWDEILKSPATIFTFSPGGDEIVAIGWSAAAGRFYRILECC